VAELELAGNQKLRFYWLAEARSLAIELWKPETRRDGHGLVCQGYRTLRGAELSAFITKLAALPDPSTTPLTLTTQKGDL